MEKQSSKSFTITEPDILITRLALAQPTFPSDHIKQLHFFFLVSYFEKPRICTSRENGFQEFQNWYLKFLLYPSIFAQLTFSSHSVEQAYLVQQV
jgi:hypothetical protein